MLRLVRVDKRRRRCFSFVLFCVAFGSLSVEGFVSRTPVKPSVRMIRSQNGRLLSLGTSSTSTSLRAKLWDRLQIEEDPEPYWYLLNCIAGLERDLLRQCRETCEGMPDAVKFVVPTTRKTRSHGANRMVTEDLVCYPGYVFGKLRLCPEVYEAIQSLDLCRSWMGTVNRKGYKKLPPAPLALNELEVENFGLEDLEFVEEVDEDESDIILDDVEDDEEPKSKVDQEALKVYQGLKVEDMIKVTKRCKFYDEDGIVKRLKDGKVLIRFYTYGTMFDEWMDPGDVRVLSNVEILRGLSGPTQPITQRDFDGPGDDRRGGGSFSRRNSPGSLRNNLMSNVKGARGPRNRQRDRDARGDQYKRDFFGRTDGERRREEKNWKWYQENQRKGQDRRAPATGQVDDEWNFKAGSSRNKNEERDDWALRDVDSQWGRQSQRQRRKNIREDKRVENAIEGDDDWSKFVGPSSSSPSKSAADEDDFFASLMSDLSDDLETSPSNDDQGGGGNARQKTSGEKQNKISSAQSDDDFFTSLMSELSTDEENRGRKSAKTSPQGTSSSDIDDDFFEALEAELGTALQAEEKSASELSTDERDTGITSTKTSPKGTSSSGVEDDFFESLEAELGTALQGEEKSVSDSGDDADEFFAKLEAEMMPSASQGDVSAPASSSDALDAASKFEVSEPSVVEEPKSTISSTKKETPSKDSADKIPVSSSADSSDLSKLTVPVLKEMLRERGLKLSGKKAELIERLKQ